MTPFHVGMKVVCIDASLFNWATFPNPEVGGIYVIDAITDHIPMGVKLKYDITIGLSLIDFPTDWYGSICFRPLIKTDISIFEAMLAPKQKGRKHEPAT